MHTHSLIRKFNVVVYSGTYSEFALLILFAISSYFGGVKKPGYTVFTDISHAVFVFHSLH